MKKTNIKQTEIGMIPEDWVISTIEEATEVIIDYRGKTPKKTTYGIPLITAKIVKNGHILEPKEFISENDYEEWMRRGMPQQGDVIITTEAPMGEVAQLDNRKVALAQRLITLRGKNNLLNNNFLRFVLQSPLLQNELMKRESGTTVTGIKQSELRKVLLPLPPYPEQKAISDILLGLDSKIALIRATNSTLESIGQALFKHWFVDFEFPNDEGKPYKSSGGEMIFSEKLNRQVPKYWEINSLGEVANFDRGFSYKGSEKYDEEANYVFITLNNVKEGGGFKPEYAWIASDRLKERHFLSEGDLIITNTEQTKDGRLLAYPAIVYFPYDYKEKVGVFSHHITKVSPKNIAYRHFLYFFLKITQNESVGFHTGSVIWGLDTASFAMHRHMTVPPKALLEVFHNVTDNIFRKIIENHKQIVVLSEIRDVLLPKLMSGEIRVN